MSEIFTQLGLQHSVTKIRVVDENLAKIWIFSFKCLYNDMRLKGYMDV